MTTSGPDRPTTRQRLLAAAISVLREEGAQAVSTTRLAREAGIVQSGFYRHFPTVEACLAEAAALVVEQVREPVRTSMELLRREELDLQTPAAGPLRAHFTRVLALLVPRWPALAVLLAQRRVPGPTGAALTRAHDDVVADVAGYLAELARADGVPLAGRHARVRLLAVLVTDAVLAATEQLVGDPELEPATVAEVLADLTRHAVGESFQRLRELAGRPLV